tara:strand:+ start:8357 stop:8593 length:237 start_codon:yes stop_codon:yes gene_type:complete
MRNQKKIRYKGKPSEPLDSVVFSNYEIKILKHGNTGHVLYRYPSKAHDWENCWTMDLQSAKSGILKYQEHLKQDKEEN